jgi:hypothetical protein
MMEGLGGPVRMEHYDIGGIDPALDDCCRREVESNRRYNAKTAALAERRRRNLVQLRNTTDEAVDDGCRCCYDPNSDGGQYRALMELRAERDEIKKRIAEDLNEDDNDDNEDDEEEKKREQEEDNREMKRNHDNLKDATVSDDDDDDDEFDYLLDEDDDLPYDSGIKALEESRRAELEYELLSREVAMQHGYGTHRQLHPARVLKAAGLGNRGTVRDPPQGVVLHLVDPDSRASASLDLYLEDVLSKKYPGTIFLRSGGRSTLLDAALAQRAFFRHTLEPDRDMPALIAIRDGVVIHTAPLLRGLVDREGDVIVEGAVHDWLSQSGVLLTQAPPMEALCFIRPEEEALMDYMGKAPPPPQEAPNLAHRFNCGLADCNKTFYHEHVGISTSEQDGLLVSEADVSGSNIS